ncbi:MAG: hypothetical protein RO257_14735 [Candidatus Kapabacteria bacterium]|nr:hypothetical protein [Candidatus Kapabacteria bacterium]
MKKEVKKVQNKIENSETETPEETIISSEVNENENLENDADEFEKVLMASDEVKDAKPVSEEKVSEPKPVSENAEVVNKQKIKALKRSIENKTFTIEREEIKVKDWRVQAADRDKLATEEFEKKKSAIEESLKKNQERFNKRMAKTKKWWHEYSDNYEVTKIQKLKDELALLQAELLKYDTEPTETK